MSLAGSFTTAARFLSVASLLILVSAPPGRARPEIELRTSRLSERVLIVGTHTGNSGAVAVSSDSGLVLIDTFWSPSAARQARQVIEREFGRSDFIYVINTSADDMSARGNAAFPGATVVGHRDCRESLIRSMGNLDSELGRRADEFHDRVVRSEQQLEEMGPGSEEAGFMRAWIALCRRVEYDMRERYSIVPPEVTFSDRMEIRLGDITLELVYFGGTYNHGDTFVMIPEEGLVFLADVFHAGHSLPRAWGALGEVDVGRWVETLEYVVGRGGDFRHVIRANGEEPWTVERVRQHLELIEGVAGEVEAADSAGLTMMDAIEALSPLDEKFPFIKSWEAYVSHGDQIISGDVESLASFLWRQSHDSAADAVASVLENEGGDAARRAFRDMLSSPEYYLSEGEFNAWGYRYLGEDRISEATVMFRLAVEAFPGSYNVYDSLGEAYMVGGERELAIENYRKSLEINPDNTNAVEMLKRLESE